MLSLAQQQRNEKAQVARTRSGNKGGRPKGSIARHTRKNIAVREAFAKQVEKNIEPLFNALFAKAIDGDVNALKELLDRAWGKPSQEVKLDVNVKIDLVDIAARAIRLHQDQEGMYTNIEATDVSPTEIQTP